MVEHACCFSTQRLGQEDCCELETSLRYRMWPYFENKILGSDLIAQQVKALATKPEDLNLIPRVQRVEGEGQTLKVVFQSPREYCGANIHIYSHTHTHINKCNFKKSDYKKYCLSSSKHIRYFYTRKNKKSYTKETDAGSSLGSLWA